MSTTLTPHDPEVLDAIQRVASALGHQLAFGPYAAEDIQQEVAVFCIEALPRFRPEAGTLECFFYRHAKNRCLNLKRNKTRRSDSPCPRCHRGDPCGEDGRVCPKYAAWAKRQEAKARVNRPVPLESIAEADEPCTAVEADVAGRELLSLIDQHLDVDLRSIYLQMRAGKAVPKHQRRAVENAVREILGDALEEQVA